MSFYLFTGERWRGKEEGKRDEGEEGEGRSILKTGTKKEEGKRGGEEEEETKT